LRASDADVIALVELVDYHMPALEAVADIYPYQETYTGVIFGKGLISRYPIVETSGPMHFGTRSTYLFTLIDVNGQPLQAVVAHAPRPVVTRSGYHYESGTDDDFHALAAQAGSDIPTIMMGDFNTTDQSENYAQLANAGLTDAHRQAGSGLGLTFPARFFGPIPVVRIDFVWVSQAFDVLDVHVGPDAGSDHLPVIARLAWRTDATTEATADLVR
jgi:endonuclease/exonuclease/phosphatase (EEP) superfamily protein YafD